MNRPRTITLRPGSRPAPGRFAARARRCAAPFALLPLALGGCAASPHAPVSPGVQASENGPGSTLLITPLDACTDEAPLAVWARAAPPATHFADVRPGIDPDDALQLRRTRALARSPGLADAQSQGQGQGLMWRSSRAEAPARAQTIDEQSASEETFILDASGAVALVRTVEPADAVTTWFDPPMLVAPARLTPGQPVTQSFEMIVRPLARPEQIKTRGPAEVTLTLVGFARVCTPAGAWDAAHLRSELKVTLGQARVTVLTDSWLAEGVGMVAEETRERVTVLGLPIRGTHRRWALDRR